MDQVQVEDRWIHKWWMEPIYPMTDPGGRPAYVKTYMEHQQKSTIHVGKYTLVFQSPPVIPCEYPCLEAVKSPNKPGVLGAPQTPILRRYLED